MRQQLSQKGFTLIELLIYVAIFATMIGAVVGLALGASAERINSQVVSDLNYQGEATIALMTQTIRQAGQVTAPTAGNSSSGLQLTMANAAVNPTTFTAVNDGTTNRLQIGEGSPAVTSQLTNGRVTVSSLVFSNMSLAGSKGSVLIKLTLKYRTNSNRREVQYSKTFYGAATIPGVATP
ncbi:MAG: type II secretion system protein [Candidatus Saccharimonadales bacterium]